MKLVELVGSLELLAVAEDAAVERLEDGRVRVSRPGEALIFDLDADVYRYGSAAGFARQLRQRVSS